MDDIIVKSVSIKCKICGKTTGNTGELCTEHMMADGNVWILDEKTWQWKRKKRAL
jgi:hypothetical protein